jgi:hypothetical protein
VERSEDLEVAAVAKVEAEFARRAAGLKPWSIREYLDAVAEVHVRYARFRHFQQKQVAA